MKSIIKYIGIVLVIVGVLLVMKNLFTKDTSWTSSKKTSSKAVYYTARVKLLDKESDAYLSGAKLVIKDESGKVVAEWTTDAGVHLVNKLTSGKYTLVEVEAPADYVLNEKAVSFEIKNKSSDVVMYNVKMTEEEIVEARKKNTTANEVNVESTGTGKNFITILIALISVAIGTLLINKTKKFN